MSVAIRGTGVAAASCAFLLRSAGFPVQTMSADRPRLPVILLPDSSRALLSDVLTLKEAFRNVHRIERRVVQWGPGCSPVVIPHSAAVVSERYLLQQVPSGSEADAPSEHPDWTIVCDRSASGDRVQHVFGTRRATVAAVHISEACDAAACWIESLTDGWLFLIPERTGAGWLISVGAAPESNLQRSQLIRAQVRSVEPGGREFASSPAVLWPLSGPNWLACGSAALRFDPLCGDGTGHAVREAILACAVIRSNRIPAVDLHIHYRMRLLAGFQRHLSVCRGFYQSGGEGPWWTAELAALDQGIQWCAREIAAAPPVRYRLNGWTLEPAR